MSTDQNFSVRRNENSGTPQKNLRGGAVAAPVRCPQTPVCQLIADSGSTKTAWCLNDGTQRQYFQTSGINPFQLDKDGLVATLRDSLPAAVSRVSEVHFYGAGCTQEKIPVMVSALRRVLPTAESVQTATDMLGAARAVSGSRAGIICILGTGSNSCLYDGKDITDHVPALGYALGDEGSGAYIGRRIVTDCLKRQVSDKVQALLRDETGVTEAALIENVYRKPLPNRYLASLSLFCARHRDMAEIHDLLIDSFSQFIQRNVLAYGKPDLPVCFVGSIAANYREELTEALDTYHCRVGDIIQAPLQNLVDYHENNPSDERKN